MIYHRGLAEALGVSHETLEQMTMRELVELAHGRGGELCVSVGGGEGPGLTLADRRVQAGAEHG